MPFLGLKRWRSSLKRACRNLHLIAVLYNFHFKSRIIKSYVEMWKIYNRVMIYPKGVDNGSSSSLHLSKFDTKFEQTWLPTQMEEVTLTSQNRPDSKGIFHFIIYETIKRIVHPMSNEYFQYRRTGDIIREDVVKMLIIVLLCLVITSLLPI